MGFYDQKQLVMSELDYAINNIPESQINRVLDLIEHANKIFVLGLGRAGYAIRSFGMRLMHMGKEVYSIFEMNTPNFEENDVLIIASGSGETKLMNQMAEKAKGIGGAVIAFTTNQNSTLTKICDAALTLRAPSKKQPDSSFISAQPMASLYEQSVLLAGDMLILELMQRNAKQNGNMFVRHSNLE